MNKKVFVITGPGGVGKSSVFKKLIDNIKDMQMQFEINSGCSIYPLPMTTTRPPREEEKNADTDKSINIRFITDEQFKEDKEKGKITFYEEVHTDMEDESLHWKYTVHEDDIKEGQYYICTGSPNYVKKVLFPRFGVKNVYIINLKADWPTIFSRQANDKNRNSTLEGCKEICHRFLSDLENFSDIIGTIKEAGGKDTNIIADMDTSKRSIDSIFYSIEGIIIEKVTGITIFRYMYNNYMDKT